MKFCKNKQVTVIKITFLVRNFLIIFWLLKGNTSFHPLIEINTRDRILARFID